MHIVLQRLAKEYPQDNTHTGARVDPLIEDLAGQSRSSLLFAWGAVGLVLLIACANAANLMLARAGTRKREIAIRAAIGAGRPRLVRHLLTESVLLAVAGGAAGLMLALWSAKLLSDLLPDTEEIQMVRLDEADVNLPVLGFTLLISLVTAVLFGLAPALRGSRVEIHDALMGAGRSTEGREGMRLRGALVVLQVALSLVLLAGAGLMVNSFWRLHQIRLGFRTDHLLTLRSVLGSVPPYVTDLGIKKDRFGNKFRHWAPTSESVRFPSA